MKFQKLASITLIISTLALWSCDLKVPNPRKLPYLGIPQRVENVVDGKKVTEEIPFVLPPFRFLNQDSLWVTNETFKGKIYITDFFFTKCPSICPIMTKQMLRIHDRFKGNPDIALLSHSIDYINDSIPALRAYAQNIGIQTAEKWHFVECIRQKTSKMAEQYMNTAVENADAPGGFEHSGYIVLVDKSGHLRAYCDGTDPKSVDKFMEDIEILLNEKME